MARPFLLPRRVFVIDLRKIPTQDRTSAEEIRPHTDNFFCELKSVPAAMVLSAESDKFTAHAFIP